jgi:uncharacterized protein (TIGR02246 family)
MWSRILRATIALAAWAAASSAAHSQDRPSAGAVDPAVAEIRTSGEQFVKAFNEGKPAEIAGMFLPQGELIDEEGNVTQGTKELTELLSQYFAKFQGAKLALDIESIRPVSSNLAIEEGTRFIEGGKEGGRAQLRYLAVRVKGQDGRWQIASIREFADDPPPTPHDYLENLSWLVGDWVNEASDGVAKFSYRWSEDKNYLLGDIELTIAGKPAMKSSQRIGYDAATGKVRSWLFDSDGGFSEGVWTEVEDGWVIKSFSSNPDGSTGTATLTVSAKDKDHYVLKGTERIVGFSREPDFELAIARRPPVAGGE